MALQGSAAFNPCARDRFVSSFGVNPMPLKLLVRSRLKDVFPYSYNLTEIEIDPLHYGSLDFQMSLKLIMFRKLVDVG